jgi:hypothetical protein
VQLAATCRKQSTRSCRVMNKENRRAGSRHKQLTEKNQLWSVTSRVYHNAHMTTWTPQDLQFRTHQKKGATILEANWHLGKKTQ